MMARTKWIFGGQQSAQPSPDTKTAAEPMAPTADAKKFGFENFGNTCYANSVLQALYFCGPFRDLVIQTADASLLRDPPVPAPDPAPKSPPPQQPLVPVRRKPERKPSSAGPPDTPALPLAPPHPIPPSPQTLFSALRSLFLFISTHPSDKGVVAPKAFIDKLKESKEDFRGTMHQDAHEFLNHLLNMIVEEMEEDRKSAQNNAQGDDLSGSLATLASKAPPTIVTATTSSNSGTSPQDATLVHKLFEGVLTSETRCLTCETVSSRDESFLDLSIDIEQNSSVTACLRSFSASEMLCQRNKFFCDSCCDLQEAEKRMKIKKLPNVLALHLKRFKFQEDVQKYIKLTYRVAFPHEIRLFNTVDDLDNADRLYNLFAIVVHIGNGPHHGHYISIVKSAGTWLVFDDENVTPILEADIPKYYGDSNSGSAYVLYYQAADIDLVSLGLKTPEPLLLPDPQADSVATRSQAPSQQSHQLAPSLPPGLGEVNDVGEEAAVIVTPPPTLSPVASTPAHESSTASSADVSYPPPNGNPTSPPASPASPTTRSLYPVRRVASSHARPATATSQADRSDRSMRSDSTPRSPRHSASSPTLAVPDDPPLIPPVPPLPGLTPTTVATHVNGKFKDKDKDKDKIRKESKASEWFKQKRRSFRLGEKSKNEKNEKPHDDVPPSPVSKDDKPASTGWFKPNSQIKRQTSQIATTQLPQKADSLPSYKLEPPQAITAASSNTSSNATNQDGFSSSGPSIVLSSPPTTISPSPPPLPPKPSISRSSLSTEQLEFPPSRKSSLAPAPRSRASMDYRRNGTGPTHSHTGPRPATVAGSAPIPNGFRHLPPIPYSPLHPQSPTPQSPHQQRNPSIPVSTTVINGTGPFVSEPDSIYPPSANGHDTASSLNHSNSMSASASSLHTSQPTSPPPPSGFAHNSLGNSVTASSNPSNGGGFKRAKRKLSLTAPILGLGKKEKEKDARKEKVSPSSFMQRF